MEIYLNHILTKDEQISRERFLKLSKVFKNYPVVRKHKLKKLIKSYDNKIK